MTQTAAERLPVVIRVRTDIEQGDLKETFELTTFGQYYRKGKGFYLLYEEILDVGKIKSFVKFSDEEAVIMRSGALNMRLAFRIQQLMKGHYDTPYGAMDTLTYTKQIRHQQTSEKEGKLNLVYDLTLQEDRAGTYYMEISYKEDHASEHR